MVKDNREFSSSVVACTSTIPERKENSVWYCLLCCKRAHFCHMVRLCQLEKTMSIFSFLSRMQREVVKNFMLQAAVAERTSSSREGGNFRARSHLLA